MSPARTAINVTGHFTAGCFVRRRLRSILNALLSAGWEFHWFEDRGWIESKFTITGRDAAKVVDAVGRSM